MWVVRRMLSSVTLSVTESTFSVVIIKVKWAFAFLLSTRYIRRLYIAGIFLEYDNVSVGGREPVDIVLDSNTALLTEKTWYLLLLTVRVLLNCSAHLFVNQKTY